MHFPMSPCGRAHVTITFKGAKKRKVTVLHTKVDNCRRKSATKFLCAKIFSGKVVKHSLACLMVHKLLVEHVLFYLKYWANLTNPSPSKRRLPIDIRL